MAAAVSTRLRRETAPLADYLFSRSEAGCTHTQLIEGVETLSVKHRVWRKRANVHKLSGMACRQSHRDAQEE